MNYPLVSIITPVYNLEKYIEATIQTVLLQTYKNWEWIIADDGSDDSTLEIISKYKDDRIKIIKEKRTRNISRLRNIAAKQALGEYLIILDGDDLIYKTKIEFQVNFMEKHQLNWGFTAVENFFEKNQKKTMRKIKFDLSENISSKYALATLLETNYICTSSVIIRRETFINIGGFKETYIYAEDRDLWLRLAAMGNNLGYISHPLTIYRIRELGSYNYYKLDYLNFNFTAYKDFCNEFPKFAKLHKTTINNYFAKNYKNIFITTIIKENRFKYQLILKSIFINPLNKNTWGVLFRSIFLRENLKNKLQE